MKKLSKIKLNIIEEQLYIEGLVNEMYQNIATYGEKPSDIKLMIESEKKGDNIKGVVDEIATDLKLAPGLIFTFGTGITAFIEPVNELLTGSGFNLNEKDIILLIITSIALLLNNPDSKKLVGHVKEKGLYSALNGVKDLISTTKEVINAVVKNTAGTAYSLSDILAFTFLLNPVTKIINELILNHGITVNSVNELFKGLLFATITYSVKSVLKRIKNKFS
jgi:competence protein ComGC